MIKTKLFRAVPFFIALGLIIQPTVAVNAAEHEAVNTSTTIIMNEKDSEMMIKQEIYVNSERYPDFGVEVFENKTYLPADVIAEKMGDRLEGSVESGYYLRKNVNSDKIMLGRVLNIIPDEGIYLLNGHVNKLDMKIINNHLYVPINFFKDVIGYDIKEDGNSVYIGEIKEKESYPNTITNGVWKLENSKWNYLNGNTKVTGWVRDNNNWYYLNDEDIMQTGWIKLNDKWYYLNENGAMQTGWLLNNGNYYHLNKDGDMSYNTVVDGFIIAENGVRSSLNNFDI